MGERSRRCSARGACLATVVGAVSLAVAACGGPISATRDAREIEVGAGEEFEIVLDANPSVGDEWRIAEGPDATVARLLSERWDGDSDATGASGRTTFRFEALAPGSATIVVFNCYRCVGADAPSPENVTLAESLRFQVTVT